MYMCSYSHFRVQPRNTAAASTTHRADGPHGFRVDDPCSLSNVIFFHGGVVCVLCAFQRVVVHAGGSMSSGHYYAYVRSSSGNWAKMDDSCVSKVRYSSRRVKSEFFPT